MEDDSPITSVGHAMIINKKDSYGLGVPRTASLSINNCNDKESLYQKLSAEKAKFLLNKKYEGIGSKLTVHNKFFPSKAKQCKSHFRIAAIVGLFFLLIFFCFVIFSVYFPLSWWFFFSGTSTSSALLKSMSFVNSSMNVSASSLYVFGTNFTSRSLRTPSSRFLYEQAEEVTSRKAMVSLYVADIILLCLSAGFSGLTLSIMSCDTLSLEVVSTSGREPDRHYARRILPLRRRSYLLLTTLIFGNVMVNTGIAQITDHLFKGWIATIASTALITLLGEVVPQAAMSAHPLTCGSYGAPIVETLIILFYPVCKPIALFLDSVLKTDPGQVYDREEMKHLMLHHASRAVVGGVDSADVDLMLGVMKMSETVVAAVATPISAVFMLEAHVRLTEDIVEEVMGSGKSRIPIYLGTRNTIVGMLHAKDLLQWRPEDSTRAIDIARFYNRHFAVVSAETTLAHMLLHFQRGVHLSITQTVQESDDGGDPFYVVTGVVTVEDVIEELLRFEIYDEYDTNPSAPRRTLVGGGRETGAGGNGGAATDAARAANCSSSTRDESEVVLPFVCDGNAPVGGAPTTLGIPRQLTLAFSQHFSRIRLPRTTLYSCVSRLLYLDAFRDCLTLLLATVVSRQRALTSDRKGVSSISGDGAQKGKDETNDTALLTDLFSKSYLCPSSLSSSGHNANGVTTSGGAHNDGETVPLRGPVVALAQNPRDAVMYLRGCFPHHASGSSSLSPSLDDGSGSVLDAFAAAVEQNSTAYQLRPPRGAAGAGWLSNNLYLYHPFLFYCGRWVCDGGKPPATSSVGHLGKSTGGDGGGGGVLHNATDNNNNSSSNVGCDYELGSLRLRRSTSSAMTMVVSGKLEVVPLKMASGFTTARALAREEPVQLNPVSKTARATPTSRVDRKGVLLPAAEEADRLGREDDIMEEMKPRESWLAEQTRELSSGAPRPGTTGVSFSVESGSAEVGAAAALSCSATHEDSNLTFTNFTHEAAENGDAPPTVVGVLAVQPEGREVSSCSSFPLSSPVGFKTLEREGRSLDETKHGLRSGHNHFFGTLSAPLRAIKGSKKKGGKSCFKKISELDESRSSDLHEGGTDAYKEKKMKGGGGDAGGVSGAAVSVCNALDTSVVSEETEGAVLNMEGMRNGARRVDYACRAVARSVILQINHTQYKAIIEAMKAQFEGWGKKKEDKETPLRTELI